MEDGLDRAAWLRSLPSYGPDWDRAIDYGIDVSLIEQTLAMSLDERFQESLRLTRFAEALEAARESLHGPTK